MSRTQNLRQNVVNQMIDSINNGHLRSPLPSQAALAEMYNISRTTVRWRTCPSVACWKKSAMTTLFYAGHCRKMASTARTFLLMNRGKRLKRRSTK